MCVIRSASARFIEHMRAQEIRDTFSVLSISEQIPLAKITGREGCRKNGSSEGVTLVTCIRVGFGGTCYSKI